MATKTNTCEGMPIGSVTGSNQNSAGTSGDALTFGRGATSTTVGTATVGEVLFGSKSLRITAAAGEFCYAYWQWGGVAAASARCGFRLPATATAATDIVSLIQNGTSTKAASVRLGTDGKLTVRNAADATVYTTPSALTFPGVYQIAIAVQPGLGTTDGKLTFAVYDAAGSLTAGMGAPYESLAANVGAGATINSVNMGKIVGTTWGPVTFYMDAFQSTDTYVLPPAYVAPNYPGMSVWNGTAELPVTQLAVWDGVNEIVISSLSVLQASVPTMVVGTGSLPPGGASYAIPGGAIYVATNGSDTTGTGSISAPYRTLTKAVSVVAAGGTIIMRGGAYHEGGAPGTQGTGVTINTQCTVQSYPGEAVWMDGASTIAPWTVHSAGVWRYDGWTHTFDHSGTFSWGGPETGSTSMVDPAYPLASWPEQVWVGATKLDQVASLAAVTAGKFYIDTTADRIYIGTDPTGQTVRVSDLTCAITVAGAGSGTVLRGFGCRAYANSVPNFGVIKANRSNVVIQNVWIEDCATTAFSVYGDTFSNVRLSYCTALRSGLLGLQAEKANGLIVEHCRFDDSNHQRFRVGQAAGAIKITRSKNVTFRLSAATGSIGPAFWCDQSVVHVDMLSCDAINNTGAGFYIENGTDGLIANCISANNQKGIHVLGTDQVTMWNNTLTGNVEDLVIQHDERTPANTPSNLDSRYPNDPELDWWIDQVEVYNTVFSDSGVPLLRIKDDATADPKRGWESFGLVADGNLYNRTAPGHPDQIIHFTDADGTDLYMSWTTYLATAPALDTHSMFIDGSTVLTGSYALQPAVRAQLAAGGVARPLPANIAALLGQDTGTLAVGAIR